LQDKLEGRKHYIIDENYPVNYKKCYNQSGI
jgi:hypothetical protein